MTWNCWCDTLFLKTDTVLRVSTPKSGRGFEYQYRYGVTKGVIRKDGSFLSFVVERGRVNVETGKRYGQRYVFYFRSSCGIADDNCLTTAGKLSIVVSGSGLYDGI